MNPASSARQPTPHERGPAWLPRSAFVSVALWLVLLGAALGCAFAMWEAWDEILHQRYARMGFGRTIFLLLERAADDGALTGALTALWFLFALLLACAWAPVRARLEPREFGALLRSSERTLRAQVSVAAAFGVAILVLTYTGAGLKRAELYLLCLLAALGIAGLWAIARQLRRSPNPHDPRAQATAFAAALALLVFVSLGFLVDRGRIWRPFDPKTIVANALLAAGAAATFVLVRRRLTGAGALRGTWMRAAALLAILPALGPLLVRASATWWGHSAFKPESALNVVVIGIDTLRFDSVDLQPPAEGERDRTPNLRKLARSGVVFDQAISQSPWTMPAFASMFTGKYPLEHGAVSLTGILRDREVTLAEILREAGYRTGSFVSNEYTNRRHGFAQGCDEFKDEFTLAANEISSQGISDQAVDFIERHAKQPFYLFAHYVDPHSEYLDHKDWAWADGYQGWWKDQLDMDNLERNQSLVGPLDMRWIRDLYDEEIANTDSQIARVVAALEQQGVLDRTLILVVVDHGEEFLDHGKFNHTTTLYEELVHVPLVVVSPRGAPPGTRRDDVVETRSVFTTVLESLDLEFAFKSRPRGLLTPPPPSDPAAPAGEHTLGNTGHAFSMVWLPDAKPKWGKKFQIVSLRTARWKLIYSITRDVYELYDIAADPLEKHELSAKESVHFRQLREVLDAWLAGQKANAADVPTQTLDADLAERLKALGYM